MWFDVGIKRYTTSPFLSSLLRQLWFDVGIKRYTTFWYRLVNESCCGLM